MLGDITNIPKEQGLNVQQKISKGHDLTNPTTIGFARDDLAGANKQPQKLVASTIACPRPSLNIQKPQSVPVGSSESLVRSTAMLQTDMFTNLLQIAASGTAWRPKLNDKKRGICVSNAKFAGSKAAALKAVTIVPQCAPEALRDLLLERNAAPKYDSMMESLRLLHRFADDDGNNEQTGLELRWAKYKAVFPTKGRDFIVLTGCVSLADARARGWSAGGEGKGEGEHEGDREDAGDEERTYVIASREADELLPLLRPDQTGGPSGDDGTAETWVALSKCVRRKECVRGNLRVSGFLIRPHAGAGGGTELTMLSHAELNGKIPPTLINKFAVSAPAKMLAAIRKLAAAL